MADEDAPALLPDDRAIASVLDELSFWSSRFGGLLFRQLALRKGIVGLDLGCGNGFPLFELAQVHGRSCRFVGADIWTATIERAASKLPTYGLGTVALVQADGAALPFPGVQFDLIVSNIGINNFADPQGVLSECRRVAKAGARLVLTTNPKGHMREFYDLYRQTLVALGLSQYLARLEAQETHRMNRASLIQMGEQAGFRSSRVVEESFVMRYLDGAAFFSHCLTRFGFLEGWRSVVDAADADVVFAALEKNLDGRAATDGELRMTVPMLYLEFVAE